MKTVFRAALAWLALLCAAAAAPPKDSHTVDFAAHDGVIELEDALGPYKMPANLQPRSSSWYSFSATNNGARTAMRVLEAGPSAQAALAIFPHSTRPSIISLASPDPGAIVETAKAYGGRAYLVTVPPGATIGLAVEIANGESPPSLLAWTEPALAAHNRQMAIFIAAIAGLIFAAAAIAAGLAVMTGHKAPIWAAATLTFVLLARLAGSGMFDASLATHVGGPYGLVALFSGLSLISGAWLGNLVVPIDERWPGSERFLRIALGSTAAVAGFAYIGLPFATLLTDLLVVLGSGMLAAYLLDRGRRGSQPARMLTPSAIVFALVTLATILTHLGLLGRSSVAPDIAGGFAAAGAVLLALAVAAGEGIAVLPGSARSAPTERLAIGASHQGIYDLEFASDEIVLSSEAARLLAFDAPDGARIPHPAWIARIHPEDRAVYEQALSEFRGQSGLAFRIEFRFRDEVGRLVWLELRATMMGEGGTPRCLGLIADIGARKQSEGQPQSAEALRDPLTGLGNRAALSHALESLGEGFLDATLALLDIDRFKSIHASLGDSGGDAILTQTAERLSTHFAGEAQAFRFSGDCFALLVPHAGESAQALGASLVKLCGTAYTEAGRSVFAPVSVGLTVGHDARDTADLVRNAELALMQAKRDGGGCARLYLRAMAAVPQGDAVALEAELRAALDQGQIEVFYQPIVRLAGDSVAGFEALLRWRHPEKGLVAPQEFIAHSEGTGLIVTLGRFALEQATRDLAQWQRFFPLHPPLFVSVNVSRRQLRDAAFETQLRQLIEGASIAPHSLKLEITENAAVSDMKAILRRLRALGAGLAIDDFGTGQSSLSQLKDLPFDTVKIDRSFLTRHGGTDGASDSAVVLGSIVALAHDLKREVVVEGVESAAEAQQVRALGCEFAQGFHYAPPLPLADALNYIARHYNTRSAVAD
ncbi:MAG: GGDEF domain-containing protein [Alphaproteobacteria bacterium]|nr:GGDEF domain-containing protein [Alphaproteobacteria bacterium]MBV9693268.1 GGDEF domain-containing protein [Alphaproteobacteria bacterium]